MAHAPGSLKVARSAPSVYVRVQGLGIASVGLDLWDFSEEMAREGFSAFIVDLQDCQSFDSTFMGVLVGMAEEASKTEGGGVMVIHPSDHHKRLLAEVGLTKIISIREEPIDLPDRIELTPLKDLPRTSDKRVRQIRKAHQRLVEIDERNKVKFGPFLDMLAQEISEENEA